MASEKATAAAEQAIALPLKRPEQDASSHPAKVDTVEQIVCPAQGQVQLPLYGMQDASLPPSVSLTSSCASS